MEGSNHHNFSQAQAFTIFYPLDLSGAALVLKVGVMEKTQKTFISYESFKSNFENTRKDSISMSTPISLTPTTIRRNREVVRKETKALANNKPSQIEGNKNQLKQVNLPTVNFNPNGKESKGKRKVIPSPLPYRCRECGKEYRKIESLRMHFMQHLIYNMNSSPPPYTCRRENCTRKFSQRRDRKLHEQRHFKQPLDFDIERVRKMLQRL